MIIRQAQSKTEIRLQDPKLFKPLDRCPICKADDIRVSIKSHDNHYGVDGEYQHFECQSCKALFLNPMPTEEFLSGAYPTDYYAYQQVRVDSPLKSITKKILFLDSYTKDPSFEKPGVMLDIGCGNGEFLYKMFRQGWKTHGVEPSEQAALVGNNFEKELNIHNGTLLSAGYPDKYFDYIRSNHSLEHIPNPHEVLKEIARIIKPGAKLFIGVPNTKSYAFDTYGGYWWCLGAPQHPINYNESSLKALVLPYGFKVSSCRTNSNYTGLLGSYQIKVNNRHSKRSDVGFLINFMPLRAISGFISRILDLKGQGDCLEMVFEKQ